MVSKSCKWEEDWQGDWETDCGNIFYINEGGPHDNKMKFCCYCGENLKEKRYAESTPQGGVRWA